MIPIWKPVLALFKIVRNKYIEETAIIVNNSEQEYRGIARFDWVD